MDIWSALNPQPTEEEITNNVLGGTLLALAENTQSAQQDSVTARAASFNAMRTDENGNNTSGMRASVSPSGTMVLSQAPMSNVAGRLTAQSVDERIRSIAKLTDPTEKAIAHGQLMADFEATKLDAYNEALNTAKNAQGLALLKQQLLTLERQATPVRAYGYNDTVGELKSPPNIAQLEQQIQATKALIAQVENNATTVATKALGNNMLLATLGKKLEVVSPVINRDTEKSMALGMEADAKKTAKQEAEDTKNAAVIAQFPAQVLQRTRAMFPEMTDDLKAAYFLTSKKQADPSAYAAITAPFEQLPKLSIVDNNQAAATLLVKEEAARTGKTEAQVQAEFDDLSKIYKDKKLLKAQLERLYPNTGSAEEKNANNSTKAAIISSFSEVQLGKKEEVAAARLARMELAKTARTAALTAQVADNLASLQSPELADTVAEVTKLGLRPNLENVANVFLGDSLGAERVAKVKELSAYISKAIKPLTVGSLGRVDADTLNRQIQAMQADPSFFERFMRSARSEDALNAMRRSPAGF